MKTHRIPTATRPRILARALGLLAALVLLASADPALALSQGPRNAGSQLGCTLTGCGQSVGASNGLCSFTVVSSQTISLGNYGFTVPASAQITGIRVEPDIHRRSSIPQAQLLKGGSPVGTVKNINVGPSADNFSCSDAAFVSLGADGDMWGTTWTAAEVNATGFGVRVGNQAMFLDSVRITVFYTIPVAVCGDGVVTHDEQCDDGNIHRGDGCSAKCQIEQVLDSAAQKCVTTINSDGVAVESAQGAQALACLKAAQKGTEPDAQGCLENARNALVKVMNRTTADAAKFCALPPAFGFTSPEETNAAAVDARLDLMADVFGADLTTAVITTAADRVGAACQVAIAGGLQRLVDARTKPFLKCKQAALHHKTAPALSGADLELCLNTGDHEDDNIAAAAAALARTMDSKCSGVDLKETLPGRCAAAVDSEDFAACVSTRVACHVCRFVNAADGLEYPCQFFHPLVGGTCQ